jgi:hypothetical protein
VCSQLIAQASLPQRELPVPICNEAGWGPEWLWLWWYKEKTQPYIIHHNKQYIIIISKHTAIMWAERLVLWEELATPGIRS